MIYDTPWDTTACAALQSNKIQKDVLSTITFGANEVPVNIGRGMPVFKFKLIDGTNEHQKVLPPFQFPIVVDNPDNRTQSKQIILDIRSCGSDRMGVFKVSNQGSTEFRVKMKQAILNYLWVNERYDEIYATSTFPLRAYAKFVSNLIGNKFYLDAHQKIRIEVIAAWFYICQFSDKDSYNDHERSMIIGKILRVLGSNIIGLDMIEAWLKNMPVINTLEEFCKQIISASDAVQLNSLNIFTFYSLLSNACMVGGVVSGRMLAQAAIEHPPTWIAILLEATVMRGNNKTSIGMTLTDSILRKTSDDFIKSIHHLIGGKDAINALDYDTYFAY